MIMNEYIADINRSKIRRVEIRTVPVVKE